MGARRTRLSTTRATAAPDRVCFEFGDRPYWAAVRVNQPVVCPLHRGPTQRLLDSLEPQAVLRTFEPRDPERAGCLIKIDVSG